MDSELDSELTTTLPDGGLFTLRDGYVYWDGTDRVVGKVTDVRTDGNGLSITAKIDDKEAYDRILGRPSD